MLVSAVIRAQSDFSAKRVARTARFQYKGLCCWFFIALPPSGRSLHWNCRLDYRSRALPANRQDNTIISTTSTDAPAITLLSVGRRGNVLTASQVPRSDRTFTANTISLSHPTLASAFFCIQPHFLSKHKPSSYAPQVGLKLQKSLSRYRRIHLP